jgi:hypothetical protein
VAGTYRPASARPGGEGAARPGGEAANSATPAAKGTVARHPGSRAMRSLAAVTCRTSPSRR